MHGTGRQGRVSIGRGPNQAPGQTEGGRKRRPSGDQALQPPVPVEPAVVPAPPPLDFVAAAAEAIVEPTAAWYLVRNLTGVALTWNNIRVSPSLTEVAEGVRELAEFASLRPNPLGMNEALVQMTADRGLLTDLELFIIFVEHFRQSRKTAWKVITLAGMFTQAPSLEAAFEKSCLEKQFNRPAGAPRLAILCGLLLNEGVREAVRKSWQQSIKRAANVPQDVLDLIKEYDGLSGAIKEYILCEDEYINVLRTALDAVNLRKTARINEVRPYKQSLLAFNRARAGVLSDAEKAVAIAQYYSDAALRARMTEVAWLEFAKTRKAASAITTGLGPFRDFRPSGRKDTLGARRILVPNCSAALSKLASNSAPDNGAGSRGDVNPEPAVEEMDFEDILQGPDVDFAL